LPSSPPDHTIGQPSAWADSSDHLEGGIGDVLGDLTPDRDLRTAAHLHVLDSALILLGQVLGQRLLGLVQVVVRVEEGERQFTRRHEILLGWF